VKKCARRARSFWAKRISRSGPTSLEPSTGAPRGGQGEIRTRGQKPIGLEPGTASGGGRFVRAGRWAPHRDRRVNRVPSSGWRWWGKPTVGLVSAADHSVALVARHGRPGAQRGRRALIAERDWSRRRRRVRCTWPGESTRGLHAKALGDKDALKGSGWGSSGALLGRARAFRRPKMREKDLESLGAVPSTSSSRRSMPRRMEAMLLS